MMMMMMNTITSARTAARQLVYDW